MRSNRIAHPWLFALLVLIFFVAATRHHSGISDYVKDLSDPDAEIRARAANELGYAQPKAYFAADALIQATRDPEPDVKRRAMGALGALYVSDPHERLAPNQEPGRTRAIAALGKGMEDVQTDVRWAAIQALGRIGQPAVAYAPRFEQMLGDDREERVQALAADALRRVLPDGNKKLRDMLDKASLSAKSAIIRALGNSTDPEDLATILPFLKSPEPRLMIAVLFDLQTHRYELDPAIPEQVVALCNHPDGQVRGSAIRAAAHLVDKDRLAQILAKAQNDPDPAVVSAVRNVSARLNPHTRPASSGPSSRPVRPTRTPHPAKP
jgi:HEAT repeat protein